MSRVCCVALPCGAIRLSAVCDCGISYSVTISEYKCAKNKAKEFCTVLLHSFESNQLGKPSF